MVWDSWHVSPNLFIFHHHRLGARLHGNICQYFCPMKYLHYYFWLMLTLSVAKTVRKEQKKFLYEILPEKVLVRDYLASLNSQDSSGNTAAKSWLHNALPYACSYFYLYIYHCLPPLYLVTFFIHIILLCFVREMFVTLVYKNYYVNLTEVIWFTRPGADVYCWFKYYTCTCYGWCMRVNMSRFITEFVSRHLHCRCSTGQYLHSVVQVL